MEPLSDAPRKKALAIINAFCSNHLEPFRPLVQELQRPSTLISPSERVSSLRQLSRHLNRVWSSAKELSLIESMSELVHDKPSEQVKTTTSGSSSSSSSGSSSGSSSSNSGDNITQEIASVEADVSSALRMAAEAAASWSDPTKIDLNESDGGLGSGHRGSPAGTVFFLALSMSSQTSTLT